ncbi:MAG: Mut7-C RNAse domain-containing protein [Thermodesulfobacteriota bacterium]
MASGVITFYFRGDTRELLHRQHQEQVSFAYNLARRASIKDIIEALGVVHTEVGAIVDDDGQWSFDRIPQGGECLKIEPLSPETLPTQATILRPVPLPRLSFMVDNNVGKLARLMRMAGFDAVSVPTGGLQEIGLAARREQRVLLSRNRELLRCRVVSHGRLIRHHDPEQQLAEVIELYDLFTELQPFSRCLLCNDLLQEVAKSEIIDHLEPLTRKYYDRFRQCPGCGRVYWKGSHHQRMGEVLKALEREKSL